MRISSLAVVAALVAGMGVARADSADTKRAADLYSAAEQDMKDSKYEDAVRDYAAAYELTKDPVLFFKLGSAFEKAGKCEPAIAYYRRYLAEAKPTEKFVALTKERLAGCGATPEPDTLPPTNPPPTNPPPANPPPTGTPDLTVKPVVVVQKAHGNAAAWITVGASIALATTGVVFAFSASSSENDVKDLYAGFGGVPPAFDDKTAKRYQELLDEGHRYEHLSWASFGLAAVGAGVATYLFVHDGNSRTELVPAVTPTSAGAAATFRF